MRFGPLLRRPLSGVRLTLGPRVIRLTIVSVRLGRSIPPPMECMTIVRGPSLCSGTTPPPLNVWSVLSFMNMLTTYRTFVGITTYYRRWGMTNILRRLKHVWLKLCIVFVGTKLKIRYEKLCKSCIRWICCSWCV
jgi:hypothetical protein